MTLKEQQEDSGMRFSWQLGFRAGLKFPVCRSGLVWLKLPICVNGRNCYIFFFKAFPDVGTRGRVQGESYKTSSNQTSKNGAMLFIAYTKSISTHNVVFQICNYNSNFSHYFYLLQKKTTKFFNSVFHVVFQVSSVF